MRPIQSFDPSVSVPNASIQTNGISKNEQLALFNDSIFTLLLTFQDGSIDILPACWCRDFVIKTMPMGKVAWSILNQLNPAINYPISSVYGVLYEPGEHIPGINALMQRGISVTGGGNIGGKC